MCDSEWSPHTDVGEPSDADPLISDALESIGGDLLQIDVNQEPAVVLADLLVLRYGDGAKIRAQEIEKKFPEDKLAPLVSSELRRRYYYSYIKCQMT